jgi:hypothetical protein
VLTDEDIAELSALVLATPAPPSVDEQIAALMHAVQVSPGLKSIRAAVAARPPRPPSAPKVKPAPKPVDRTLARLKGRVSHYAKRVNECNEALAAIAATTPGSREHSAATFHAINAVSNQHSDRAALATAQANLDAYLARETAV